MFDPRSISGLRAWYDAKDYSTLTVDGSSKVTSWRDKSGYGNHMSQAVSVNAPTYSTFANGLPCVACDTGLTLSAADSTGFDGASLTVVHAFARSSNTGSAHAMMFKGTTAGSNAEWQIGVSSGATHNFNFSTSGTAFGTTFNTSTNVVDTLYVTDVIMDNTNALSTVSGRRMDSRSFTGRFVGDGSLSLAGSPTKHAEIMYFNAAITQNDITKIRRYLSRKWSISL